MGVLFCYFANNEYLCAKISTGLKRFILYILLIITATVAYARQYTVVIDPGHGGKDPGAVGKISKEKDHNLAVALMVGKMIQDSFPTVRVIYTRKTDVFVELDERANIANRAKANLFMSIHTNSVANTAAKGTETFSLGLHRSAENLEVAMRENSVISMESDADEKYEGFDPKCSESYIMFEFMQDANLYESIKLAKCLQRRYKSQGREDRGVFQGGFLVLRETSMPSVLTEIGFISNPEEEAYLCTEEGRRQIAQSIFEGFKQYHSIKKN